MSSMRRDNKTRETGSRLLPPNSGVQEVQSEIRIPVSGTWLIEGPSLSTGAQRSTRLDIGFTGTRHGMSSVQITFVGSLLRRIAGKYLFPDCELWGHHGDCIESDEQFHGLATSEGFAIHLHPPDNPKFRAWCKAEVNEPEKPYGRRNQDIVDAVVLLIATPHRAEFDSRSLYSGTWMTIRMAKEARKPYVIIYPDGRVEGGNEWEKLLK